MRVLCDSDKKYLLRIEHDCDCESPADFDCQWKIYTFGNRLITDALKSRFLDDNGNPRMWLRNKIRVGLAFPLNYSEHGLSNYAVGHGDFSDGVVVWEHSPSEIGAKDVAGREKDCAAFCEEYTRWANGECCGYVIEDATGELIDSCWGFIGEYVIEAIREALPEDATEENTEIAGECKDITSYLPVFKAKGSVDRQ
jgi:hypothetical protein